MTARFATTRTIPYPSPRLFSGSRSAITAPLAGPPIHARVPTSAETITKLSNVGANHIPNALKEGNTRLKMITPLRPMRSVNAPSSTPPIKLETENTANTNPTVDKPTPNFFVMNKAKNGYAYSRRTHRRTQWGYTTKMQRIHDSFLQVYDLPYSSSLPILLWRLKESFTLPDRRPSTLPGNGRNKRRSF